MKDLFKSKLLIEDEEYYYLFRSLNSGDKEDIKTGVVSAVDENGNAVLDPEGRRVISRLRVDRDRFLEKGEEIKYSSEDEEECSLEQIFDHVKMHQRKDTNCISLSSNSNVTFTYYSKESPEYVVIKVKKDDDSKLINVCEYMLEEIEKRINEIITRVTNPIALNALANINLATTSEEIKNIVREHEKEIIRARHSDIEHRYKGTNSVESLRTRDYTTGTFGEITYLNKEQNLAITRIIAKIKTLEDFDLMENITSNGDSTTNLIATMKSALASAEYAHYGEIKGENVVRISKENLQAISLLQQYKDRKPEKSEEVDKIILEILDKNSKFEKVVNKVEEREEIEDLEIGEALVLTDAKIPYSEANEQMKDFVNLSRGKLDAIRLIEDLERTFGEKEIFKDMKESCLLVSPEIVNKRNGSGYRICESVNLISNLSNEKFRRILKKVNTFSVQELEEMALGKTKRFVGVESGTHISERIPIKGSISKSNRYFAEALVDTYDWKNLNRRLRKKEREKIIRSILRLNRGNTLRSNMLERLYKSFENAGFERKDIPGAIINIAINKKIGSIEYTELVYSEEQEKLISDNIEEIDSLIKEIDLEILLGKDKFVTQRLKKLGINSEFLDPENTSFKSVSNLYWSERLVEKFDWKKEIGRNLTQKEKASFIELMLNYKKLDLYGDYKENTLMATLYKNMLKIGVSEEDASRFIIRGSLGFSNISNFFGNRKKLYDEISLNPNQLSKKISEYDVNKARLLYEIARDEDGEKIKSKLIKQGFNSEFIKNKRTDNLYFCEYIVNHMNFDRKLSENEKIAIMEQILDLSSFDKKGACKLSTVCENLMEEFDIKFEDLATVLLNTSIEGVKKGIGYKRIVVSKEFFKQIDKKEFNDTLQEETVLETIIIKRVREKGQTDFYKNQLRLLGIEDESIDRCSEKDLGWTYEIFKSINFKDRLGRNLTEEETKAIILPFLHRSNDGTTIQGLYHKLKALGINNIPELLVNIALGNSGVNGLTFSTQTIQSLKKSIEKSETLNNLVTEEILSRRMNDIASEKEDVTEELLKIGVRKDFFEKNGQNKKKNRNVYWINKIVNEYDWERKFGRKITDHERMLIIERLLEPSIMNENAEVYVGNYINYMQEKGIKNDEICGYLINLAVKGCEKKGISYTTVLSNTNILDKYLEISGNNAGIIDKNILESLEFNYLVNSDNNGEETYKRMKERGIRADFIDDGSEDKKDYRAFLFAEKIIKEYDFEKKFGRKITKEEENAIIEKMLNISQLNKKAKIKINSTYETLQTLDLKGLDPLGVMLYIGFERIDTKKVNDPYMDYGRILTSEVHAKKIGQYIEFISDTITESTLRKELINSKINKKEEVDGTYIYYDDLGVDSQILKQKDDKKAIANLMLARKIVDDYDFVSILGRELTKDEEKLILESILDFSPSNLKQGKDLFRLYNNVEKLGGNSHEIAGIIINLTMSKRRKMTYSQLIGDLNSYEKLKEIEDEIRTDIDEETIRKLSEFRKNKSLANKIIKSSVSPKRNEKGRKALDELMQKKEKEGYLYEE